MIFLRLWRSIPLFGHKKAQKAQKTRPLKDAIFQLCDQVRETSFALHRHLRHGHIEKIYENGLFNRWRKGGVGVFQQHPLSVLDEDGTLLGAFAVDLFVNECLIAG